MDRFGQNMPLALEAYNKGPTFVAAEQELGVLEALVVVGH